MNANKFMSYEYCKAMFKLTINEYETNVTSLWEFFEYCMWIFYAQGENAPPILKTHVKKISKNKDDESIFNAAYDVIFKDLKAFAEDKHLQFF